MVSKSCEVDTIFLGGHCFVKFSFFHVVGVNAFVISRADEVIALVIKIQGGHVFRRFLLAGIETLAQRTVRLNMVNIHVDFDLPC